MSMDTIDDFTFFGFGVGGDGETWACGGVSDFWGRCAWGSGDGGFGLGVGEVSGGGGRVHERDGGCAELCLGRDNLDAAAEDVDGGRHVVVV